MSTGNIKIILELDDGKLSAQVQNAQGAIRSLTAAVNQADRSMASASASTKSFGTTLYEATATISLMRGALQNLYSVTGQWAAGILKTNAQMERMTYLMKGFSQASSETEQWKEAEQNVQWIKDFAKTTPFGIKTITDSFVRLKSVGTDPATGSLRAMTDAVAQAGKGPEELQRAMLAIQQMIGKSTMSMEELRQQMAEAIPRAMEMMARGMNMTVAEFGDKVKDGLIKSREALTLFYAELDRTFGGSGLRLMASFDGQLEVLKTNWINFQTTIGNAANAQGETFFSQAKKSLIELNAYLNSMDASYVGQQIGLSLIEVTKAVSGAIQWIIRFKSEILSVGAAFTTWFVVRTVGNALAALVGSVGGVNTILTTMSANLRESGAQATFMSGTCNVLAGATGFLANATRGAAIAVGLLSAAIRGLTVITAIISMVYALAQAMSVLKSTSRQAWIEVGRVRSIRSQDEANELQSSLDSDRKKLNNIDRQIAIIEQEKNASSSSIQILKGLKTQRETLNNQILENQEKFNKGMEGLNKQTGMEIAQTDRLLNNSAADAKRQQYDERQKVYLDRLDKAKTDAEKESIRQQMVGSQKQLYRDLGQVTEQEITRVNKLEQDALVKGDKAAVAAYKERAKELLEQRNQLLEQLNMADPNSALKPGKVEKTGGGAKPKESKPAPTPGDDRFEAALLREKAAQASVLAEMEGRSATAAKIIEQYYNGYYDDGAKRPSKERLEEIIKIAEATDALKQKLEDKKKIEQDATSAERDMQNAYEESTASLEEYMKVISNPNAIRNEGLEKAGAHLEKNLAIIRRTEDEARITADEERRRAVYQQAIKEQSAKVVADMIAKTKEMNRALLDEDDQKRQVFEEDVARMRTLANVEQLTGQQRIDTQARLNEYIQARTKTFQREMEGPIAQEMRNWGKMLDNLEAAGANWLDQLSDQLATFATTGKMNFKDFANSVINDLARIQMKAAMSGLFKQGTNLLNGALGSALSGLLGSGGAAAAGGSAAPYGLGTYQPIGVSHTGGMADEARHMRYINADLFSAAARFHEGRMGLKPNELRAIITKDESVLTPDQMRAMGKNRGSGDVQVNVINQTQQPVSAQTGQPRFDGEKLILDVVLKAVGRPGEFREQMKGAFAL